MSECNFYILLIIIEKLLSYDLKFSAFAKEALSLSLMQEETKQKEIMTKAKEMEVCILFLNPSVKSIFLQGLITLVM